MAAEHKIKPYFVVGWTVKLARRLLAGRGVLISHALIEDGRISTDDIKAFTESGCDVVFDNGEFSRWKSGREPNGEAFYDFLEASDFPWRWACALDVIGSAEGTAKNWAHVKATRPELAKKLVPVFHEGDPWELLTEYSSNSQLVALGRIEGRESKRKTFEWYDACFNRRPELRAHALGNASPETLEPYPFESFDASSWERAAAYSNRHGWPFNRCSRESRMRAYVEACETITHTHQKQLSLSWSYS